MEIDKQLYADIKEYCELNGLKPREFTNNLLKKAFMEEKYGKMPAVVAKNETFSPKIGIETIQVSKDEKKEEESRQSVANDVAKGIENVQNGDFPDTTKKQQTIKRRKI